MTGSPDDYAAPKYGPRDPRERALLGRLGAEVSWARTVDRTARTQPGRDALKARFLKEADGDPVRAEHLYKAHFLRLSLLARKARAERRKEATL